jgi:hypothetical protein
VTTASADGRISAARVVYDNEKPGTMTVSDLIIDGVLSRSSEPHGTLNLFEEGGREGGRPLGFDANPG